MDVSQYLSVFLDEAKEHLQSLNDNIMILEQDPENEDCINEIFRSAHSMKVDHGQHVGDAQWGADEALAAVSGFVHGSQEVERKTVVVVGKHLLRSRQHHGCGFRQHVDHIVGVGIGVGLFLVLVVVCNLFHLHFLVLVVRGSRTRQHHATCNDG